MSSSTAFDSFRYGLSPELVKLYIVAAVGWVIVDSAQEVFFIIPIPWVEALVSSFASLCGLLLLLGGLVGAVHQVLSDSMQTVR